MKKLLFIAVALLAANFVFGQKVEKRKLVQVSNMKQFIQALDDDVTIEFLNEFYFLEAGGSTLELLDYKNVTLRGVSKRKTKFLTDNPDAPVMRFKGCENITLENLELGHAPIKSFSCDGPVLVFQNTSRVTIDNCFLFGSGYEGINASNVSSFRMINTVIRGCTGGIMSFSDSEDLSFNNCSFTDNVGLQEMIVFTHCKRMQMNDCEITMNRMVYEESEVENSHAMISAYKSQGLQVMDCVIAGNATPFLFYREKDFNLDEKCSVHHNKIFARDSKVK